MVFVIGSYSLAREVRVKRPVRKDKAQKAAGPAAAVAPAPAVTADAGAVEGARDDARTPTPTG